MHIEIHHELRYRYTPAVFLEPTVLRLRPRSDFAHTLHAFDLAIDPAPAGRAEALDAHGNVVTWAWFTDQHEHLRINARSTVELVLSNPFNYLVEDPAAMRLPMRYSDTLQPVLAPFLAPLAADAQVHAAAEQLRAEAGNESQVFLSSALQWIQGRCEMIERDTGEAHPPSETIARGAGACRDLAVLFIELCRCVGLAARFVSGYHGTREVEGPRQMHAWAEVYLPGAGWRGYDPSYGLVAADEHVAVAAGRTSMDAAPTHGSFRRTGAQASFAFHIDIIHTAGDAAADPADDAP